MAEGNAREIAQMLANRRRFQARFVPIQMKTANTIGSKAMKLYLVKTDRPSANPSNAAFLGVDVSSLENRLKRKSTRTNSGMVMQSVPIVAAWMTRTGRNVSSAMKPA